MCYTETIYANTYYAQSILVADGTYKGYFWLILTSGSHPCAYVQIPKSYPFYHLVKKAVKTYYTGAAQSQNFEAFVRRIKVHGGITCVDTDICGREGLYIGWDYAHYPQDYVGYMLGGNKRWTVDEIKQEVVSVINQLVAISTTYRVEQR